MAVLLSGTTIGGHIAVHANNIGTYALTAIPSSISVTNVTIGNAIYFGGGNNYFNWTNSRIYSNVGIQSANSMYAPVFYDSDDPSYYLDISATGTSLRIGGGIAQNNIVGRPYAAWGASGTATGAVVIKFPGAAANYGMVHAVIDIYEYSGNDACTVIVGGHNWNSAWYSYGAQVIGNTNKQVRVAFKDGKYCIVIGDGSSSWSYGQVVLRKIQNGTYYSGVMDIAAGYTAAIETDTYSWVSADLRNLETPSNFTAGGIIYASGGNSSNWNTAFGWGNHASAGYVPSARTITINGTALDLTANRSWTISTITGNAGTATTLQNARTLTIGNTGKTFNGSADVSWTLAEIGAQAAGSYAAASHTHDDRYYTETESDSRFLNTSGDTSTGMQIFYTSLTNNDDWQNSPISIMERGQVGTTQSALQYAPNLNFHWSSRYSKSLWTDLSGVLRFGEYNASGVPQTDGTIAAATFSGALSGNATTATTLQTARSINGTSFNGSGDITTANWGTTRTITIGGTGKSVNGSGNVSWSLGEIQAEYEVPLNTIRNNLGSPTVREAALFHGQFNNKFRFIPPTLQEESTDGTTWVTSTRASAANLGDMMIGEGEGTGFNAIPSAAVGTYGAYRLTWDVVGQTGYVFLNALYIWNSTNGNTVNITIERFHNTNGWETVCGPLAASNWPGHAYIPHSNIPYSNNASQYNKVRVTFTTTHNTNTNAFTLYAIEWFGGYPQGRRNVESYDRNKNVYFPNSIQGSRLVSTVGTGTSPLSVSSTTVVGNLNADMVDGYHSSSLWRADGGSWNPNANILLNQTANNQEWSFDITRNGYTGGYWHVWDSSNSTMLKVDAVTGKVSAPYNFVGNLEGNATTATTAGALTSMNISQFTNNSGYITGYTETDTLASVTGRGNTTTTSIGVSTNSPINLAVSGNIGTWLGGIQDATSGWSIANNGIGLKADNTTYSGIVMGPGNGILYFGRTLSGVGTMGSWLEVNNSGVANFKLARPQHNGSNLALVSEIPTNLNQLTNGPGYITGNQTITLGGDVSGSGTTSISVTVNNIDGWGFVNTGSNSAVNADSINSNGISYYTGGVTNFSGNATDGALYSQRYSDAWQHQIAGDYRSGQIALRGKNNGTWQAWRTVLDSSNFSTWAATASHTHSYLPLSGGDLTGSIGVPSGSSVFLATSGDSNWRIGRNLVTESDNSLTGSTMQFIAANATDQGWQFVNSAGKTIVEISSHTNGGLFTINQKEFWLKQPIGGRLTTIRKKSTDTLSPNPIKIADTSLAAYSANSNPNTYIIIQTSIPQDEYQMGGFTIDLFANYNSTNGKTKIDLGGYWNPEGNGGFDGWEAHGTNPQVKPTIQVARNTNSGMTAIIISGITWNYPVVVARDLYLGYNSADGGGYGFGWHIYSAANINDFTNVDTVVWRNAYSDSNPAGYITGYTETDTLATVTARGNTTNGAINVNGNILLTGTATTTNQGRMIDFTGFDKEGTTDFSDRAYIQHTINDAGHTGSVLVISSQNDADDGIGFLTNASSQIKHNSHVMWDAGNDGAGSGLDADLLDGLELHTGTNNVANRVVRTDGNGYANFGWINTISGNTTGTISDVYVNTADGYIRKATPAHFISNLGLATSASLASASVSYATTANRLERYGIIYGDDWNSYNQNNRLIAISSHNHTGANRPAGAYTYGSGLSYYNSGSDHYQFFFPENGGSSNANNYKIWYRSGWNNSWGGWRSLVDLYNGACAIDGTVTATGDIIAYSDVRVKENIHTIENALDKTLKLRGVTYNRTDVEDKSTKIGVIAQEIMEVLPELVSEDETGMYGVSYGNLTAVLIEAIKEQQKQIEELKLEVQKLKSI